MPQFLSDWFIVETAFAQVHQEPTFNSSCLTEGVLGESCRILDQKENWFQVRLEDGYEGWMNSFYGIEQSERNKPTHRIVFPNEKGFFDPLFPFGAKTDQNLPGSIQLTDILEFDQILPVAINLLGIPYKWGGKTSLGFDCSGLVQSVFKPCGLDLPRDSFQQRDFFADYEIDFEECNPGDLHFFGKNGKVTHVAISTGGKGILHAQGMVREDNLGNEKIFSNQKLLDMYMSTHSIRSKFRS
ncbi:MAG: C40 family peptidase [Candidatus Neomarinimicrobiota bacterium]|nr:C40 family peptidase [Candidatus Neomarinimicrobiota bacterium]